MIIWRVMRVDPFDGLISHFAGQDGSTWYDLRYVDGHWRMVTTVVGAFQTFPDQVVECYPSFHDAVTENPVISDLNDLLKSPSVDKC